MAKGSSVEERFVLEEAPRHRIVDPRGRQEQPLAAIAGEDLEPALSLVPGSPEPGARGAVGDNGPEAVVFSGGRRDREECAIDYFRPTTASTVIASGSGEKSGCSRPPGEEQRAISRMSSSQAPVRTNGNGKH